MATPKMTRPEIVGEFIGYLVDVFSQQLSHDQRRPKLVAILDRFWDTSVRTTVSTLTPEDAELENWTDDELAEALRVHTFRQGGIRNGIFDKILEAADRLSKRTQAQAIVACMNEEEPSVARYYAEKARAPGNGSGTGAHAAPAFGGPTG